MEKEKRRIDLPIYPRAFIAAARLSRENGRVFVVMPFNDKHSDALWRIVQGVCSIRELNARRADSSLYPNPIIADILEEIERAEIIIADLTGLNPNVLYEVGISHVRCDSVVLLCQQGQLLPFDLANIRSIFFDLGTHEGQIKLAEWLGNTLDALMTIGQPLVIDSPIDRTKFIIRDLQKLASLPDRELSKETVWLSGFLSSLAISPEEPFLPEEKEYRDLLIKEKEAILSLACRGCLIRCIITPPMEMCIVPVITTNYSRNRILCLLNLLESKNQELNNIEWAISPYMQKNLIIIGCISCFEGYKKGFQTRGYGFTLRQTGLAVTANISLCEALFNQLSINTLCTYGEPGGKLETREALRRATVNCLRKSIQYIDFYNSPSSSPSEYQSKSAMPLT